MFCCQERLSRVLRSKAKGGATFLVCNAYHGSIIDLYRDFATVLRVQRASVLAADAAFRGQTYEAVILIGERWRDMTRHLPVRSGDLR